MDETPTFQPESNNFVQEEFEKVDSIPEQDEEVTTTSYTGEEATEEDRYTSGTSSLEAAASDNLLDFGVDQVQQSFDKTPVSENFDSLINLGPPVPEPSAPPVVAGVFSDDLLGGSTENNILSTSEQESTSLKTESKVIPEPVEVSKSPAETWIKKVDPRDEEKEQDESEIVQNLPSSLSSREAQKHYTGPDDSTIPEEKSLVVQPPVFLDLIYWKDIKKTGVVFGSMLFVLLSLSCFSVLSVLAYLSLAVLTVTLSFRVYKNVLQAVQKSGDAHPFRAYLDMDIDLPEDKAIQAGANILKHINCTLRELRRLFLIEDMVDSLKFALLLWVLTYVGSWFNGMTLIILVVVNIFTLPKIYETYKVQIDNYVNIARSQINNVVSQVQAKLPFLKKKEKKQ